MEPEAARGEDPHQPRDDRAYRTGPSPGSRASQGTDQDARHRIADRPRTPPGLSLSRSGAPGDRSRARDRRAHPTSAASESLFALALGSRGDRAGGPRVVGRRSTLHRGRQQFRCSALRAGLECSRRSRRRQGTSARPDRGPDRGRGQGTEIGPEGTTAREGCCCCCRGAAAAAARKAKAAQANSTNQTSSTDTQTVSPPVVSSPGLPLTGSSGGGGRGGGSSGPAPSLGHGIGSG